MTLKQGQYNQSRHIKLSRAAWLAIESSAMWTQVSDTCYMFVPQWTTQAGTQSCHPPIMTQFVIHTELHKGSLQANLYTAH